MVKKNFKHLGTSSQLILVLLIIANIVIGKGLIDFRRHLIVKQDDLALKNQDLEKLNLLDEDYKNNATDIELVLSTLPESYKELAILAYKIEELGKSSGLNVKLSFDKELTSESGLNYVNLKIDTTGGYQNYTNFIKLLNNLPYNINVQKFEIEINEGVLSQSTILGIYMQKTI